MDTTPFILGIAIAFSFGTGDYLSKGVTARIGFYRTSIYVLILSGLGILLPAPALKSSFEVTPLVVTVLVIIASTTFLAFASLYRAYSKGMLSLTAPIVNAFPTFSVVISVALLGAAFSLPALLAIGTIIVGIVMVSTSLSDLRKRIFSSAGPLAPGVGSAFLAAILFGISWTAFGYANQHFGYLLPAVAVRLGAAGIGIALIPVLRPRTDPVSGTWIRRVVAVSSLEAVGAILFALGVTISPSPDTIPVLSTFGGMSGAVTVSYAIVLLKERLEVNHIVGVIALISGVVALLYFTS